MRTPDHDVMVGNILAVYDAADDVARAEGMGWYPTVRERVSRIAAAHGVAEANGMAAFAWLSPRVTFDRSEIMFVQLLSTGSTKGLSRMIANARECLAGDLSSMEFSKSSARKVRSFYRNLMGDDSVVTIDTHAAAIAFGGASVRNFRGQLVPMGQPDGGSYVRVQDAYVDAATARGISATAMQAVTWVARRGSAF